jgi:hypothetical protein
MLLLGDSPVTWALLQGPVGAQVSSTGLVSGWTPTTFTSATFNVQATNWAGSDSESWTVQVVSRFDLDVDGDVDIGDFAYLQNCLSGDGNFASGDCQAADSDGDNDVDALDFAGMLPCLAGSEREPGC